MARRAVRRRLRPAPARSSRCCRPTRPPTRAARSPGGRRPRSPIRAINSPVAAMQTLGPYRILREIGQGGMATVFLAERDGGDFEQRVAIKVVRGVFGGDALRRFRAERQILASLEHPSHRAPARRRRDRRRHSVPRRWSTSTACRSTSIAASASCRSASGCSCSAASATRSATRTATWSSIATSSPRTSWSPPTARRSCSTSASRAWSRTTGHRACR